MTTETSSLPLRLTNAFTCPTSSRKSVQADISDEVYDYFFRYYLAGERGVCAAMISIFFKKLYDHFQELKISQAWDETNRSTMASILNDLNFRKPESRNLGVPSLPRPANPRTPKSKKQPASSNSDTGAANGSGPSGSGTSGEISESPIITNPNYRPN